MKKIIVTAAGRRQYLSILTKYLVYYHNLGEFDEWHLWHNTEVKSDVDYIYELEKTYGFIKVIPFPDRETIQRTCFCDGPIYEANGLLCYAHTIKYFYTVDGVDENTIYLKLDDDIVFIKKESIKKMFEYRLENLDNFLICGNIVNNGVMDHIHQQMGVLPKILGEVNLDAFDKLGVWTPQFAEFVHNNFFEKYNKYLLDEYNFDTFLLKDYTHFGIQAVSWFGKDFKSFGGMIPKDIHDEQYLSTIRPKEENRPLIILGNNLFCHYAMWPQRNYLNITNVLFNYEEISNQYLLEEN
jgi:hypothetical protein